MTVQLVMLPAFVLIVLTFVLGFWMGFLRVRAIRSRKVKIKDIALREPNWPPRVTQIANAAHNQLELPVLFYILSMLELLTLQATYVFLTLAWVFVALRLAHAYIHVTSNDVRIRGPLYMLGAAVLAVMWGIWGAHVFLLR
jgi:hypothetical protein